MLFQLTRYLLLCSLLLLSCFAIAQQNIPPNEAENPPVISTGVPEGFNDLLAPQLGLVDVYYNGQPLMSSIATYTQDWIEFERPADVILLIKDLINPQQVLSILKTRLNTNSQLTCQFDYQQNCGRITPEVVAVIFDEDQFRIDLFINPDLILPTIIQMDRYLPPSTSELSFINSISLVASGGEKVNDQYALQLNSILGYKNYRIQMNIDNDSQNQTRLDQISFIYDYRDISYEIGSFKTFAQLNGFYTQRDFVGARVQTSLSSRTDLEQVSGSSLFVFLNERSRIDVFLDGQLIDSGNYSAGNVQIDTRNFPGGAYNVELKITGVSGRETSETHFYSKSLRLPPLGETLYFAEAGFPETNAQDNRFNIPHAESQPVVRAGLISRLSEKVGLNTSLVANASDFSFEVGGFFLVDKMNFQSNYIVTQESGLGSFYQLDYTLKHFILSASYRKTSREDPVKYDLNYELLQNDNRQILLNVAVPFETSTFNFFARDSERVNNTDTRVYGAGWRKNIWRGSGSLIDFSVDATRDDVESRILLGFNMRFFSRSMDVNFSAKQNSRKLRSNADVLANDLLDDNFIDKKLRIAHNSQSENLGRLSNVLEINQEQQRRTTSIKSELNNEHGFGRLEVEQVNQSNNNSLNYSIASRFNIVASRGKVAIGGSQRNSAGVMIDLESIQSDNLSFSVIINGVEQAKIDAGKSRFIALQPYETYNILLSPRGETLVNFDNKPKRVTLYPGNIENLAWEIKSVKVVIMQLLDLADKPLANALVTDFKGYARTDESGWIQLRLEDSGGLNLIDQNGNECRVEILPDEILESVNYLAQKRCQ